MRGGSTRTGVEEGGGEIERCRKSLRFAKLQLFSGTKSDVRERLEKGLKSAVHSVVARVRRADEDGDEEDGL